MDSYLHTSAGQEFADKLHFQDYIEFYKKVKIAHLEFDLDVGDDNEGSEPEEDEEVYVVDEPPSNEVSAWPLKAGY